MPLLIDGNNLAHRLRGRADRATVRRVALDFVRGRRVTVTVIFDGPPPEGKSNPERLGQVTVVYAGRWPADDVIVGRIPPGPQARSFTVVTDDRGLAGRVRNAGGRVLTLSRWMQRFQKRHVPPSPARPEAPLSPSEISEWEQFFSGRRAEEDES